MRIRGPVLEAEVFPEDKFLDPLGLSSKEISDVQRRKMRSS